MKWEDLTAYSLKQKKKVHFDLSKEHKIIKTKRGGFMAQGFDSEGNKISRILSKNDVEERSAD